MLAPTPTGVARGSRVLLLFDIGQECAIMKLKLGIDLLHSWLYYHSRAGTDNSKLNAIPESQTPSAPHLD